MQRVRITYAKLAALRYTSNLDVHKIWERSLRRARLPLAYSQGFHPQPKLIQACPLPLGLTSQAEMIDIWFDAEIPQGEIRSALEPALPPGLILHTIQPVDHGQPSLPKTVVSAEYVATFLDPSASETLPQRIADLLAAQTLPRVWRGRQYDLRLLVEKAELLPPDDQGQARLLLRLAAREGATGRVEEVMSALGYDPYEVRVERVQLVFQ